MAGGRIYVGIGGWDYDPWRGTFYPEGLAKTKQLAHAAGRLTAIEVNATNYRLQKPDTFRKWAATVPDGFKFALKASHFCTNRKVLAEAGPSIERFVAQGLTELGDRLGPILWQFTPTKMFEPEDFGAFLDLLPAEHDGVRLRHAIEPRHESFRDPAFVAMARAKGAAIVFADAETYSMIDEPTADFSYARLQQCREEEVCGYDDATLDRWAGLARGWVADGRDAFLFMIAGAKVRAPLAAEALMARL
jgi:uncharacterized protein YecE (DUF72 family)